MQKIFLNDVNIKEVAGTMENAIDMKKLEAYAHAIGVCCNGEYGQVYFKPEENHVFVCLGDSTPFDYESFKRICRRSNRKSQD